MLKKICDYWSEKQKNRQDLPCLRLLGAPDDQGVENVGGRLGAAFGPSAVRKMLGEFMLGSNSEVTQLNLDYGYDVDPRHNALRDAVAFELKNRVTPIVLGGGHDYGYPHIAGVFDVFGDRIALINVDAHFDVRPASLENFTSGSPFFLALENKVLDPKNFIEFGIQEHCNDLNFTNYVRKKKITTWMLDDLRASEKGTLATFEELILEFKKQKLKVVVSFDVDSVAMAFAPGVSAPQSDGFSASEFLQMSKICGKNDAVISVGYFELAPPLDHDEKTTRLVATAVHRFVSGFSQRTFLSQHISQ